MAIVIEMSLSYFNIVKSDASWKASKIVKFYSIGSEESTNFLSLLIVLLENAGPG